MSSRTDARKARSLLDASRRRRFPLLTDRIALGRSGLEVSPVCLGLVGRKQVITTAFEHGINFFFLTADMHWPLYEPVRAGLRALLRTSPAVRKRIVVAVVSYVTQPEFCWAPFEEVLAAVPELEHIDIGLIGGSYSRDFLSRLNQYTQRRPGGMRAIGVTCHERALAATAVNRELVDIAFVRYNSAHPGAEDDLFPRLRRPRLARLFNFQSTHGHVPHAVLDSLGLPSDNWRPEVTDHYRYALTSSHLDGLLCGLSDERQVKALALALKKGPLSSAEVEYLKKLSELAAGRAELAGS